MDFAHRSWPRRPTNIEAPPTPQETDIRVEEDPFLALLRQQRQHRQEQQQQRREDGDPTGGARRRLVQRLRGDGPRTGDRVKRSPLVWNQDEFNLTALIDSVERDIWLLEQMESGGGKGREGKEKEAEEKVGEIGPLLDLPPLFSITEEEIKNLPGYRARRGPKTTKQGYGCPKGVLSVEEGGVYIHLSPSGRKEEEEGGHAGGNNKEDKSPPPPPLPPKRRGKNRVGTFQDRILGERPSNGGNSSNSNDDGHNTADAESVTNADHIPRKNCVSNALYGHRRRRLPSPPPASTGDLLDSRLLAGSLSRRRDGHKLLFCPLCAQTFGYGFALECHLLSTHSRELERCRRGRGKDGTATMPVAVTRCPYCHAQFLSAAAALRHLHYQHAEEARDVLVRSSTSPRSGRYVQCRFCSQQFLRHHQKLMLLHVEHKHVDELGKILSENRGPSSFSSSSSCPSSSSSSSPPSPSAEVALVFSTNPSALTTRMTKWSSPALLGTGSVRGSHRRRHDEENISPISHIFFSSPSSLEEDHQFLPGEEKRRGRRSASSSSSRINQSHFYYEIEDVFSPSSRLRSTQTSSSERKKKNGGIKRMSRGRRRHSESAQIKRSRDVVEAQGGENIKRSPNSTAAGLTRTPRAASTRAMKRHKLEEAFLDKDTAGGLRRGRSTESLELSATLERRRGGGGDDGHETRLFQCNLCSAGFLENAFLLSHLKNRHRPAVGVMMALRPHYSCGACPAKFFKNSFLVRHVESRHQFELVSSVE